MWTKIKYEEDDFNSHMSELEDFKGYIYNPNYNTEKDRLFSYIGLYAEALFKKQFTGYFAMNIGEPDGGIDFDCGDFTIQILTRIIKKGRKGYNKLNVYPDDFKTKATFFCFLEVIYETHEIIYKGCISPDSIYFETFKDNNFNEWKQIDVEYLKRIDLMKYFKSSVIECPNYETSGQLNAIMQKDKETGIYAYSTRNLHKYDNKVEELKELKAKYGCKFVCPICGSSGVTPEYEECICTRL